MITVRQKGCSRKCPDKESKERIYRLKGGIEVRLRRPYSLREKGKIIRLFRAGIEISFFGQGVDPETIENYALGYEANLQRKEKAFFLKQYCEAPTSYCEAADRDCNNCTSTHKEWALERKREGKKVVRPGRKTGGLMEATEERNAALKNKENKETFSKRSFTGKWR
jgi:hypothetical protein